MSIRRVVPDIRSKHLDLSRAFYVDFLGFDVAMDMGFVMTFVSPSNPTAQVTVVRDEGDSMPVPDMTVEVSDVDEVHGRALAAGVKIVYPLTDEPWGVRRFFVADPNGRILKPLPAKAGRLRFRLKGGLRLEAA